MTYDYTCEACANTFEVSGVHVADRETARGCPSCGGPAQYDAMASMRGARTVVHQDLVSYMEGKFGRSPSWQGPTQVGANASSTATRSQPGAMRVMGGAPNTRKREV